MKWLLLVCGVFVSGCDTEIAVKLNRISDIKVPDIYDGCNDCSLIVRQMAWSMDNEPATWKTDGYYVSRNDATAWVASSDYIVRIGPDKENLGELLHDGSEAHLIYRAYRRFVTRSERFK